MKKEVEYKSWHGYIVLAIVFVAIVLGVMQKFGAPTVIPSDKSPGGAWPGFRREGSLEIQESSCNNSGGTWNQCGSACRDLQPDQACIDVCVEYCECTEDYQCPEHHHCGDIIQGTGVCTLE